MAITGQYGKGQYGESTIGPEKSQEEFKPDLKTRLMSGAKDLKDKAIIAGKNFKSALGGASEKANEPKEYVDPYNQKQKVDYRQPVKAEGDNADRQADMKNTVGSTDDLIKTGEQIGGEANTALQNVEIPRSKLVSYGDILKSDEFKGQRVPYMANAIGSNLANLLTGKDYQSYLKQQNQAMSDTYAQNKAARDTAATQANIQDIEAGNKAEMGKQVQMSDAITEQALKRYGLLEDQETKKQILNEIINQATGKSGEDADWKNLNAEEKFAVMALQQVYNGDYSVATMFLEKYGDDFARIIDGLFEKLGITKNRQPPATTSGGNEPPTTATAGPFWDGNTNADTYLDSFIEKYGNNPELLIQEVEGETGTAESSLDKLHESMWELGESGHESVGKRNQAQSIVRQAKKIAEKNRELNENFAEKLEGIAKGKTSEEVYDTLVEMSGNGSALTDSKLIKEYEDAVAEYGKKTVEDKINNIMTTDGINAETKKQMLEEMLGTDKYNNLVKQNSDLQKVVKDTKTELDNQIKYVEPLTNAITDNLLGETNVYKQVNRFEVQNDGSIKLYGGKNKDKYVGAIYPYSAVGIYNQGPGVTRFLDSLINNLSEQSIRTSVGGDLPTKQLAYILKSSPIYKTIEGIVNTKDPNLKSNEKYDTIVGLYNFWNSY